MAPFALDDGITEDERPRAAARAAVRQSAGEPVVPFSLETSSPEDAAGAADAAEPDDREGGLSEISADDPDVGVVYDDDDDVQEQVEVGADGKVKRRRRRRRFRIPVWYRSAMARKMSRLALVPLIVLLIVAAVAGVFFYREWATTRAQSKRQGALFRPRLPDVRPSCARPSRLSLRPCRRANWW